MPAAPAACQPNLVREPLVDQAGDAGFTDTSADPTKEWERYCFEQGFRTLEEVCGPYEPPSSPQMTVAQSPAWHRNFPLIFCMIGLAIIMVKLAASGGKCAGRHTPARVAPMQRRAA